MTSLEVTRLLTSPELQHDQALTAIASGFSDCASEPVGERLDDASRRLFGTGELGVHDQAQALADLLTNRLGLVPSNSDPEALLIDRALKRRRAHPLLIAAIGHELARRAGVPTYVGACAGHPWTVVHGEEGMALIGPAQMAEPPRPDSVRSCCPHALAYSVLSSLRTLGPPGWALKADQLRRVLPVRACRGETRTTD